MKSILLTAAASSLALSLNAGDKLATDYTRERTLTVSVTSSTSNETVAMEMTIDGEPMEGRGGRGFGGGGNQSDRSYSWTDSVMEAEDGAPVKVKRAFGDVSGSATMMMREEERTMDMESAFADAVVMIDATGDDQEVEVLDGGEDLDPEQFGALVPHLALDGLLPSGEVEAGDKWDVEGSALMAALHTDLESQLFRPAARGGDQGEGQRGGGRGRGGMRGGAGGGGLGIPADGEWDAKATVAEATEEVDGLECLVIEIEAEVAGDLPEREFGGGRGRGRDRMVQPELSAAPLGSTYEAEFEGRLFWSVAEARPVRFELEGTITTVRDIERETQRGVMEMHSEQERSVDVTIEISAGPKGE